jgi:hypothetical protein
MIKRSGWLIRPAGVPKTPVAGVPKPREDPTAAINALSAEERKELAEKLRLYLEEGKLPAPSLRPGSIDEMIERDLRAINKARAAGKDGGRPKNPDLQARNLKMKARI